MEQRKSSAPALERGLELLELLNRGRALSLERLARELDAPKSSVLRLADTLSGMGIIERSESDKAYRARYVLVPVYEEDGGLSEIIREALPRLCEETACTVEWYAYDGRSGAFRIIDRAEPRNAPVFVRARIGFTRELDVELESVTALGLALGFGEMDEDKPLWVRKEGVDENVYLEFDEAKEHVDRVGRELFAEDFGYNEQGVRRMAVPVLQAPGETAGILALAQSYAPGAARKSAENAVLLKETAQRIQNKLGA